MLLREKSTNTIQTAMSPQEVTEKLQLTKIKDKLWYVQPTVATDPKDDRLELAFAWLSENTKDKGPKK